MSSEGFRSLVERAQLGDVAAAEELLASVRLVLARLAARDRDGPDGADEDSDMVQLACLRAWQNIDQFRGGTDDAESWAMFRGWLAQIWRHVRVNSARDRSRQCRQPAQGLLSLGAGAKIVNGSAIDRAADEPTPGARAQENEERERVQSAIAAIPDDLDRSIIQLCFFSGLSLQQVANRLGLSYDKTRQRYHAMLRRLELVLSTLCDSGH